MISIIKNNFAQYIKTIKVKIPHQNVCTNAFWNTLYDGNMKIYLTAGVTQVCVYVWQWTKDINPFQCHLIRDFLCLTERSERITQHPQS